MDVDDVCMHCCVVSFGVVVREREKREKEKKRKRCNVTVIGRCVTVFPYFHFLCVRVIAVCQLLTLHYSIGI